MHVGATQCWLGQGRGRMGEEHPGRDEQHAKRGAVSARLKRALAAPTAEAVKTRARAPAHAPHRPGGGCLPVLRTYASQMVAAKSAAPAPPGQLASPSCHLP